MRGLFRLTAVACSLVTAGCASLVSSTGANLAGSISSAMLNQNDPEIVRAGAPAYLMMLDGMVEDAPNDPALLSAASELYAAYGVVFVDNPERSRKLTTRAFAYGQRRLCVTAPSSCGMQELPYDDYMATLAGFEEDDVPALYTYAFSWLAYIQSHADDWRALARLPEVRATLQKLKSLDPQFRPAKVEHYLAVLNTIRPPALGGDFEAGREHFERALALSGDEDLSIKVDYARYYARTLYDRPLHDRLLGEVLQADPNHRGFVLTNTLAQAEAQALLDSADEYF